MGRILTFLFVFALIYYFFKILGRVILPWFLKKQVNKMNNRQNNAYEQTKREQQKKEGEVTVHYQPKKGKKDSRDGEYVDFEEVKE